MLGRNKKMDKSEFKDFLFEILNKYGELELGLIDIIPYDSEDKFLIIEPNDKKFEVYIKQLP